VISAGEGERGWERREGESQGRSEADCFLFPLLTSHQPSDHLRCSKNKIGNSEKRMIFYLCTSNKDVSKSFFKSFSTHSSRQQRVLTFNCATYKKTSCNDCNTLTNFYVKLGECYYTL